MKTHVYVDLTCSIKIFPKTGITWGLYEKKESPSTDVREIYDFAKFICHPLSSDANTLNVHIFLRLTPGSTASNGRHGEDEQHAERRGSGGRGQRGTSRRQSRADSDRRGMDTDEPVGSRKHEAEGPDAAEYRKGETSSWSRNDRSASVVDKGLGLKLESSGGGRRSRSPPGRAGANLGVEGSHERLLWNELRESLEGVAGSDAVPPAWGHGAAVEKARVDRAREEQRRRLIDEAIAVLLEGSSSSSNSSSEDERIDNDDD